MTSQSLEEKEAARFVFWLRFWRWVIAALEVTGGLVGICSVAFGKHFGHTIVSLLLFFFVLYAASVWGGVLLALNRRGGVVVSLVVQAFQLFQVSTAGLLYSFVSGLLLPVGYRLADGGIQFQYGWYFPARFLLFCGPRNWSVPGGAFTGINVAALLSVICLLYVSAAQRREGVRPPAPKP